MAGDGPERLIREYRAYDARCDVVSCFEVFFTEAKQMAGTVEHFERFPRFAADDGQPVTPDFTVRFVDDTMLVGEISNLAQHEESLKSLLSQLARYETLAEGPAASQLGGGHQLAPVTATDLLVLVPSGEANAARDRIDEALREKRYEEMPERHPSILGYSYDDATSRYVFTYDDRASNPRPRSHGREPSLETWLLGQSDTLRCPSDRFGRVTAIKRFMNDRPPALYMATLLWLDALPAIAQPDIPPVDVAVVPADLAQWLRDNYGWGDATAVRAALAFLQRAGLARERQDDWLVALKPVASSKEEVRRELADRYLAKPGGPITADDRDAAEERRDRKRQEESDNRRRQEPLDLEDS